MPAVRCLFFGLQWRTNVTAAFGMLRRVRALRPHLLVNHIVLGKRRAILDFCWDVVEATLSLRLWRRIGCPDVGGVVSDELHVHELACVSVRFNPTHCFLAWRGSFPPVSNLVEL